MKTNLTKSFKKRIRTTKGGVVLRRAMGLGHSRSNKRRTQIKRKQHLRSAVELKK